MIVKGTQDEAKLLDNCLKNISKHVDGIFLDINARKGQKIHPSVIQVAQKYKTDYKQTVWTGNFVKARNDNFSRVPEEYTHIIWLDSDDTVEKPEKIREVCVVMASQTHGLLAKYNYEYDNHKNVTTALWVVRVVRNNNSFAWKASFADGEETVHETLVEKRKVHKVATEDFVIIHNSTDERRDQSLERNIRLLEGMLMRTAKNPDPRILYYLATHYVDAGKLQRSQELFEWYLKLSGWAEERSEAYTYLGMIYDAKQQYDAARGCYLRAVAENPDNPSPYVELGDLEMKDKLFEKAASWLEMAVKKKPNPYSTVLRPLESTYRAYKLLSQVYANIGGKSLQKARKWLTEAQKLRPFDPELEEAQKILDELVEVRDLTKATNTILNKLRTEEETDKIESFTSSLPTVMQDNPLVVSARNYYRKPVKHQKNSIAILCGWGPLGNWGPKSLEKGIGGSEEAVIRISRELMKLGYHVTIYGTPGEEHGTHWAIQGKGSVRWLHYWEFNRKDEFDIFISWRNPELFDEPIKARKSYLWLHDVMDKEEFIDARLNNLDRIIFVSQYHRDLYPFIPEDKCFVSGNGITPEDFETLDGKFKRDPHRIVYMSSHVRGLQLIYEVWDDVKKAVPDAKLDVYYGWGSYDSVNRNNPERMAWKDTMIKYEQELKDVTDHGKIGHQQIVEEIFKSGVWAYPCPFPEVYCITAVKAQAGGAVPVSSNFAALKETVKYGTILDMKAQDENTPVGQWDKEELDKFKEALIDMLKHPEKQESIRKEMMEWARTQSWAMRAKEWIGDFE